MRLRRRWRYWTAAVHAHGLGSQREGRILGSFARRAACVFWSDPRVRRGAGLWEIIRPEMARVNPCFSLPPYWFSKQFSDHALQSESRSDASETGILHFPKTRATHHLVETPRTSKNPFFAFAFDLNPGPIIDRLLPSRPRSSRRQNTDLSPSRSCVSLISALPWCPPRASQRIWDTWRGTGDGRIPGGFRWIARQELLFQISQSFSIRVLN